MRHHSQYGRSYSSGGSQLGTLNLTARGGGRGPKSGPLSLYDEVEAIDGFSIIRALLGESYPAS